MPGWEFCKIEPRIILGAEEEGPKRRSNEKFSERHFTYRMTVERFTPDGLDVMEQGPAYQALRDDSEPHKEMSEKMLSKLGQQGWEPFFTDTRTSSTFFIWHLKRKIEEAAAAPNAEPPVQAKPEA